MENQRAAKSDSILQNPRFRIAVVVVGVLFIIIIFYMVSGRVLTHYVEQQMNQRLKGYTVHVENAFFHPLTFALSLSRLVIIQDANPDPPVASIAALHASIHWKELFKGHIAGDLQLEAPILHIDLKHVRAEEKSAVPIQKKGWQEAFQSIYPIRINRFTMRNGELTYVDVGPYRPLRATDITLTASNIRNIRYPDRVYPSPVSLEAKIFDKGRLILDGNANFLEEPHFGVKAAADLKDMDISYFQPLTARVNVSIKKGITNVSGYFEYSPKITSVNLRTLNIQEPVSSMFTCLQQKNRKNSGSERQDRRPRS